MRIKLIKPDYYQLAEQVLSGKITEVSDLELIKAVLELANRWEKDIQFYREEKYQEISAEIMQDALDSNVELRG